MNSQNGTTLVALIVVMFLMLILAGISISLVVTSDQQKNNQDVKTPAPLIINNIEEPSIENTEETEQNIENTVTENIEENSIVENTVVE